MVLRLAVVAAVLAAPALPGNRVAAADLADDPQASIDATRDSLTRGANPPWYDSSSDSVQRVSLPKAIDRPQWQLGGLFVDVLWWLAWAVVAVFVSLIIYVLVKAFLLADVSTAGYAADRHATTALEAARTSSLPFTVEEPPADFLAAARASYARGDYGKCIVYLYSHLLLELDRRQIVRLTRGKTNRQYVREAAAQPEVSGYLERTMLIFEHVFFGRHRLERRELDEVWVRLDDFHARLTEAGP